MRKLNRIAVMASLLVLAGCAQVTLVSADKPAVVGDGVTVTPQRPWNQIAGDHIVWTQDGPNVDAVHFLTGVKSGKPLIHVPGVNDKDLGVFDAKMLPNDVQDMVVSTLGKRGFQNVRSENLTPCSFGADKGFCFNLDFSTADGLQMKGSVLARKKVDSLDLFLFEAPDEYYYGALLPDVQKLFASIQVR